MRASELVYSPAGTPVYHPITRRTEGSSIPIKTDWRLFSTPLVHGNDHDSGHQSRISQATSEESDQGKESVNQDAIDNSAMRQADPRILRAVKKRYRLQCGKDAGWHWTGNESSSLARLLIEGSELLRRSNSMNHRIEDTEPLETKSRESQVEFIHQGLDPAEEHDWHSTSWVSRTKEFRAKTQEDMGGLLPGVDVESQRPLILRTA